MSAQRNLTKRFPGLQPADRYESYPPARAV